jgi:succinate-acetate transporter protein
VFVEISAAVVHRKAAIAAGGQLDIMAGVGSIEVGDVFGLRVVRRAAFIGKM